MRIAYCRVAGRRHRLRWHHIAVISAISSVAYVVVVVFVIAVVVIVVVVVVLLSSRFFLLDEPYHFIRQKEITVIVASVRTIFPAHESVHEGAVPTGAASSTCSRSHRLHL